MTSSVTNISTWNYDSLGRITRAVWDGHSYEYIYDEQDTLKEKRSSGDVWFPTDYTARNRDLAAGISRDSIIKVIG